jgi:hypothetical protein
MLSNPVDRNKVQNPCVAVTLFIVARREVPYIGLYLALSEFPQERLT